MSPSLAQAQNLHKLSSLGKLDESAIEAILLTEPVLKKKVTLKVERIAPYFPRGTNPEEMEVVILRLLASWQRSREQKRAHENSGTLTFCAPCFPFGKARCSGRLIFQKQPTGLFLPKRSTFRASPSDVLLAGAFCTDSEEFEKLAFRGVSVYFVSSQIGSTRRKLLLW